MPLRCRCDPFCDGAKHPLGADGILRPLGTCVGDRAVDGALLAPDAHQECERPFIPVYCLMIVSAHVSAMLGERVGSTKCTLSVIRVCKFF